MPESGSTDPEISGLLKHLQNKPAAPQAWEAMQEYRRRALGVLPDGASRREVAEQAREEFRSRLLHLLTNGDTAGPAVEYVVKRTAVLHEQRVADQAVKNRAIDVYSEMFKHELRVLEMDDFPAGHVALLAATNNLALRRIALEEELLTERARIQSEARRKIERLLEGLEDAQ